MVSAATRSSLKRSALESTTCLAPIPRSSAACSGRRTTFTRSTPSARQIFCSICPRLEAAAVCTSALWPSMRMVSTMPRAVSGFTNHDAHSAGCVPSGKARHCPVFTPRYCEYIAPPMTPTVRPRRACAGSESPAATTTPAPSLPTGIDSSRRALTATQEVARHIGRHDRLRGRARGLRGGHVRRPEEQAQVGRVDGRGLDAHDDFVRPRIGNLDRGEGELELAFGGDGRTELSRRVTHGMAPRGVEMRPTA